VNVGGAFVSLLAGLFIGSVGVRRIRSAIAPDKHTHWVDRTKAWVFGAVYLTFSLLELVICVALVTHPLRH
jgi:hypothetical protein